MVARVLGTLISVYPISHRFVDESEWNTAGVFDLLFRRFD
jgi:hypothetical protein